MATGGRRFCRYFNTSRGCWNGDNCRFAHKDHNADDLSQARDKKDDGVKQDRKACRFFQKPGGCRFGDSCRFNHVLEIVIPSAHVVPSIEHEMKSSDLRTGTSCEKHEIEVPEKTSVSKKKEVELYYDSSSSEEEEEYVKEEEEVEHVQENEKEEKEMATWDKWLAESEDRHFPLVHKTKCGECGVQFRGPQSVGKLKNHYLENLVSADAVHKNILSTDIRFHAATMCFVCERHFGNASNLLQHIKDKSKLEHQDADQHWLVLSRGIVDAFCYRDIVTQDNEQLTEEIISILVPDSADCGINSPTALENGSDFVYEDSYGCYDGYFSDEEDYTDMMSYGLKPWEADDWDVYFTICEDGFY